MNQGKKGTTQNLWEVLSQIEGISVSVATLNEYAATHRTAAESVKLAESRLQSAREEIEQIGYADLVSDEKAAATAGAKVTDLRARISRLSDALPDLQSKHIDAAKHLTNYAGIVASKLQSMARFIGLGESQTMREEIAAKLGRPEVARLQEAWPLASHYSRDLFELAATIASDPKEIERVVGLLQERGSKIEASKAMLDFLDLSRSIQPIAA